MKIVIVDDEKPILKLYRVMLKNMAGISSITTFSSASDAIEYFNTSTDYDLVITDYCMPPEDLTGMDVAKAAQMNKPVPVLLISGSSGLSSHSEINLFDCVLMKPFSSVELLKLIEKYI